MSQAVVQRRLQIIIEDSGAQQAYERLNKQQEKLTKTIEEGRKAGRDMTAELTKLEQVKGKAAELEKVMSGKVAPSFRQVQGAVTKLRNELALMSKDAPGYAEKFARFQEVSNTFDVMRGKVNGFRNAAKSVFSEIKTVALGVTVGNTITAITQSITGFISQAVTGAAKLSDEIADIEKATGLSTREVEALNSQLGKLNTRTATSELRQIAIALGQAGEAANVANIQALDRINVALGDEFGGDTREIGNVLSVLRNNLQDLKSQDYAADVTAIGNALNELGANGLATAPVVTDIANRIAGVAGTFGVTSGEILGTAAAFQELGINVERGSTAYTKLLQKIAADTETFAQVAGVPLREFQRLVDQDINTALLKVAEGSRTAAAGNTQFALTLKELDADGAGVSELLSKLAANGDLVRQKIDLATASLQSNSSIIDEFNKKNETLGAQYDKLTKNIAAAFNSSALRSGITSFIGAINDLFDETNSASRAFQEAQREFDNTEKSLKPLLDRYDVLKSQTNLNAGEQMELRGIIQQVTEILPQAASAFDGYGNAIDINREKIGNWRDEQKQFLRDLNQDAIDSLTEDAKQSILFLSTYQQGLQLNIEQKNEAGIRQYKKLIAESQKAAIDAADELSQKYGVELPAELQKSIEKIKVALRIIADPSIGGYDGGAKFGTVVIAEAPDAPGRRTTTPRTTPASRSSSAAQTRRKREVDERKRELEQLLKELQGIEEQIFLGNLDPYEKRLNQIALKYKELFAKAGNDLKLRERILRDMLAETQQLNREFQQELEAADLQPPGESPNTEAADSINTFDLGQARRERLAQLELRTLQTTNRAKLDAQLDFLNEQEAQEIMALKAEAFRKTGSTESVQQQVLLIEERYRQLRRDAEADYQEGVLQSIQNGLQFFVEGFTAVADIIGSIEQGRLNRLEEGYQREQRSLKNLLDAKLISQTEYTRRSSQLEERLQQEKARIARREHRRMQIANTAQVLIDGASAAIRLWAVPGWPANIPLLALLAAQVGASIARIASSKPPTLARGGFVPDGPSHAQGGIAVVSRGRKIAEIEGGEPVISKPVYRANKHLIDALLRQGHTGDYRPLQPAWYTAQPGGINTQRVGRSLGRLPRYAAGGLLPNQGEQSADPQMQQLLVAILDRLNRPFFSNVIYGEYEAKAADISEIRAAGTIG